MSVPCDYCPRDATRIIERGPRTCRSFACSACRDRALYAVNPYDVWTDPPLPGRPRYTEMDADALDKFCREEYKKV